MGTEVLTFRPERGRSRFPRPFRSRARDAASHSPPPSPPPRSRLNPKTVDTSRSPSPPPPPPPSSCFSNRCLIITAGLLALVVALAVGLGVRSSNNATTQASSALAVGGRNVTREQCLADDGFCDYVGGCDGLRGDEDYDYYYDYYYDDDEFASDGRRDLARLRGGATARDDAAGPRRLGKEASSVSVAADGRLHDVCSRRRSGGGRGQVAEGASPADETVAKGASTADGVVAKAASMADGVVAEAASTADEVVVKAVSMADGVVAEAAPKAEEPLDSGGGPRGAWLLAGNARRGMPLATAPGGYAAGKRRPAAGGGLQG